MRESVGETRGGGIAWSTLAVVTVASALFVGLLDLSLALGSDGGGGAPLATYFAPAATSGACAAMAFAVSAIVARLCARFLGERIASALAVGAFGAIASVPVWIAFVHQFGLQFSALSGPRLLLVSLGTGVACVLVSATKSAVSNDRALRALSVVLALIAAGAALRCTSSWLTRVPLAAWMAGVVVLAAWLVVSKFELLAARAPLWVSGLVVLGVAPLALAAASEGPQHIAPPPATRPQARSVKRILLVVIDTLRADHLSCFDAKARATPSTDSLARDSILFEQARSCAPWTLPSMTSILTGVRPDVHQVLSVHASPSRKLPVLAQTLHDAGYHTAAIGTNTVLRSQARLDRGFDEYDFHPRLRGTTPLGTALLERAGQGPDAREGDAAQLTDAAIAWLDANAQRDTFLWLHYYDPHFPYASPEVPPDPLVARGKRGFSPLDIRAGMQICDVEQRNAVRKAYADEVAYFDRHFGRLLAFLRERGWYDEALIVLTADHGEELWDHDGVEHGQSVYDELVRIPLLIKPSGPPAPARFPDVVSNVAIGSTLLTLCGLEPTGQGFTEPALLVHEGSAWTARSPRPSLCTGTMFYENRTGLAFDHFKYIRLAFSGREELYDIAKDAGETQSLHGANSEQLAQARRLLDEFAREALARREQLGIHELDAAQIGEGALRDLRKLGYVK